MEHDNLFDRIHEALDVEPRAGAYERLRGALINHPVRPQRRPALRMRWSKMGLRLTAGLAVIVAAIAIGAVIFATRPAPVGGVPAGSGRSINAYQALMSTDDAKAVATWSAPCDTNVHTGCNADAVRALGALQPWLIDLNGSTPPARFAVIDGQVRRHLTQSITGLDALRAASQANDVAGMNRAYMRAVSGRVWTDTVVPSIIASKQVDAVGYLSSVRTQKQSLDGCAMCQSLRSQKTIDCSQPQTPTCEDLWDGTFSQVATFQAGVVQYGAPASMSAKDGRLQLDLAQADTDLMAMRTALSSSDQAGFSTTLGELQQALAAVDADAATILQG